MTGNIQYWSAFQSGQQSTIRLGVGGVGGINPSAPNYMSVSMYNANSGIPKSSMNFNGIRYKVGTKYEFRATNASIEIPSLGVNYKDDMTCTSPL